MRIRQATLSDCPNIASMHFASYQKAGQEHFPIVYLKELTYEGFLSRWQSRMKDNILTIVAEEDDKILGCFTAMNFDNKPGIKKEEIELRYLYVHPDHWREGIGTKLALDMATRLLAAGYNSVSGCALKSDLGANAFYTSLKAEVKCTKTIYIPIGTTPESYLEEHTQNRTNI